MGAYLSLIGRGRGWGGRLFEAGRLSTFSAFRIGAFIVRKSSLPKKWQTLVPGDFIRLIWRPRPSCSKLGQDNPGLVRDLN